MKIFVINGNTNTAVSKEIEKAALKTVFPGTDIMMITPAKGPSTVEGYLDGQISASAVCEEVANYELEADAFVIACFSDPGLYAARDITSKPVVGIAESSMLTAVQLGHLFSLLTPLRRLKPLLKGLVTHYGFNQRLASVGSVEISVGELAKSVEVHEEAFLAAGYEAVHDHGAEVLILAGAVLVGMEKRLSNHLNVPVLDPVKTAVAQAQALVKQGLSTSHSGGFSKPDQKLCIDCPDGLKHLYPGV